MQLTLQDTLDTGRLQAEEPSLGFGSAISKETKQNEPDQTANQTLLGDTPSASSKARGMKRSIFVVLGLVIFLLGFSTFSEGQEKAAAEEVVQKVQQAAKSLSQSGEAGLAKFDKKESFWVWKDTYVFVLDCAKGTVAAHPFRPDLIGQDDTKLKGTRGSEFFPKLCEATKTPSGVWVEYWWPKPGEKEGSRKVSYALTVSNTSYIVGAGIYDDKATIIELQKLTSSGK